MNRSERGGIFFRLLLIIVFAGFLAALYSVRHPFMRFIGEFWMTNDSAIQSDAIVVLGDDNYAGDRAFHAAELYRTGMAPLIVASGRMLRANVSIADLMQHDLESFGVPATAVVKFPSRARNTREEAEAISGLIAMRGWKRVIIVTSSYHARRAKFIFERILPSTISVRLSAAHDSEFDPSHWWETRLGRKLFLGELFGYVVARWELRRRPDPPAGVLVFAPSVR